MSLRPCTSCRRLVRASDTVCPFCSVDAGPAGTRAPAPFERRARAALLVGALTVAATTAACANGQGPVAVYGGPPPEVADAGPTVTPEPTAPGVADAGHSSVTPQPTGIPVAMYGAPPMPTR